jgi:phasin family protein
MIVAWKGLFKASGPAQACVGAFGSAPGGTIMSTDPMQKFGKEGLDMAMASFGTWSKSAQAIATELAEYSKKYFEDSAAAVEKLMAAKSVETAMAVQSEYLKSSYEEFVAQSTKIGELYSDMAKEAYKPFEGVLGKMPTVK